MIQDILNNSIVKGEVPGSNKLLSDLIKKVQPMDNFESLIDSFDFLVSAMEEEHDEQKKAKYSEDLEQWINDTSELNLEDHFGEKITTKVKIALDDFRNPFDVVFSGLKTSNDQITKTIDIIVELNNLCKKGLILKEQVTVAIQQNSSGDGTKPESTDVINDYCGKLSQFLVRILNFESPKKPRDEIPSEKWEQAKYIVALNQINKFREIKNTTKIPYGFLQRPFDLAL